MSKRVSIRAGLRKKVFQKSKNRCACCLAPGDTIFSSFEIDHIIPVSRGGLNTEDNLCASCIPCNSHKGNRVEAIDPVTSQKVSLFNPLTQDWKEHFTWAEDKAPFIGKTPVGRATVIALKMNKDGVWCPYEPTPVGTRYIASVFCSFQFLPPAPAT